MFKKMKNLYLINIVLLNKKNMIKFNILKDFKILILIIIFKINIKILN